MSTKGSEGVMLVGSWNIWWILEYINLSCKRWLPLVPRNIFQDLQLISWRVIIILGQVTLWRLVALKGGMCCWNFISWLWEGIFAWVQKFPKGHENRHRLSHILCDGSISRWAGVSINLVLSSGFNQGSAPEKTT